MLLELPWDQWPCVCGLSVVTPLERNELSLLGTFLKERSPNTLPDNPRGLVGTTYAH